MANPNNAFGTNAAFGGRTSVNAFNDVLSAFDGAGVLSGWQGVPDSGLTIKIGGNGSDRDVAIAEDPAGNKTTINNISGAPVSVTLPAAPGTNARIDAIVAYIESSPSSDAATDAPDVVNMLVVSGSASSTPLAPDDNAIRTAITADGASGSTCYYVVLVTVRVAAGTTDITAGEISSGAHAVLAGDKIMDGAVSASKIDFTTIPDMEVVDFGAEIKTTATSRTRVAQTTVSGLNTGWQYLVLINYGMFGSGNTCLSDVNVIGANESLMTSGRIRGGGEVQTSPSWSVIYTPTASTLNLELCAWSVAATTTTLESVTVKFIPLRPSNS